MMFKTPFLKLEESLTVLRDDLYPFLGGGNKGRKMDAIGEDIIRKGANALVTTGGIHSNHCRAVAVFAALHKMRCTLVLHGSAEQFSQQTGNAKIMRMSGAEIVFANEPSQIGSLMDSAMARYQRDSFVPYYIWGGGHTLDGGLAYIKAVEELKTYCENRKWWPNHIFLASGTGSTQAGILAGLDKYGMEAKVVGISVGRKTDPATKVVSDFYKELGQYYQISLRQDPVIVLDDYLCGGYGQYNSGIKSLCDRSIKDFGFSLDTCYTGKAFYGMLDYIEKHDIQKENVLFWHTGGIFNFLAE